MHEMRSLLAALLTSAAAGIAMANGLAAKNLDFQQWDEARGWPEGWGGRPATYFTVARDCEVRREERCALRISGGAGMAPGEFQPLGQSLGPAAVAGNHLVLTGWIRTANVEGGWAGMWARTDVEGKTVMLDNM